MQTGESRHVFQDPSGRRHRWLRRLGTAAAVFGAASLTVFIISLLVMPLVPHLPGMENVRKRVLGRAPIPTVPSRETRLTRYLAHKERLALLSEINRGRQKADSFKGAPATSTPEVVAGFYTIWNRSAGLESLKANADRMTHLMPEWLHLDTTGVGLDTTDWNPRVTPHNKDVVRIAFQHKLQIWPILNNAKHGQFDSTRVHKLFASARRQRVFVEGVRNWVKAQGFQGINLDFENLSASDYARLPQFVSLLTRTMHAAQLGVSVDLEPVNKRVPFRALGQAADFAILMTYPEHGGASGAGPLSSMGWYYGLLNEVAAQIPADRLVIGVGNYALDWTLGAQPIAPATLSYQVALITARDFAQDSIPEHAIDFDSTALNPTFNYKDDSGYSHEVWMLDAVTAYNQWLVANRMHLRGAALWQLGSEDPAIWAFLGKSTLRQPPSPLALSKLSFPDVVEFAGNGELLTVASAPRAGSRTIEVDSTTGICTDMQYQRFPSSDVIRREGFHRGWIALTFDDGPSGDYTGPILDVLKEYRVPATFFVIGQNAESFPELVRREYNEGHEIGNH
ncbi:MAG TPA: polysaccharide deacetylase family protein, partial [Longimicrobiales bacterium]